MKENSNWYKYSPENEFQSSARFLHVWHISQKDQIVGFIKRIAIKAIFADKKQNDRERPHEFRVLVKSSLSMNEH